MTLQTDIDGKFSVNFSATTLVDRYPEHRNYVDLINAIARDKLPSLKFWSDEQDATLKEIFRLAPQISRRLQQRNEDAK